MDHSHLDWMSRDVELWERDENYLKLFQAVNEFKIVNHPSERAVQMAEKRIKTVGSEKRFQETLLSVHELNLLCRGVQRKSFDKRELQSIVKKMMKKDYVILKLPSVGGIYSEHFVESSPETWS